MTKVPIKWKKLDNTDAAKVEINGESDATFTSASPALKVNGDVVSDNISAMASDISAQGTQMSSLTGRVEVLENALPSLSGGIVRATASMAIASGIPSDLESETGKLYSDGIAFPNHGTPIHSVWVKAYGTDSTGMSAEIGMGNTPGTLYLRQYDSTNAVSKEATLLDGNGNTIFPGVVSASSFSGDLSGTASNAQAVASMAVASGRNNVADQIMRTDASGRAQFGIVDTLATDLSSASMNKIFCSDNNEIKYKSVNNFVAGINLSDALKASDFLGFKVKFLNLYVGSVDISSAWGNAFEGHKVITFSEHGVNLGLTTIAGAWVSAWSTNGDGWEMYPSIFTISPTSADIYFIRGTSKNVPDVYIKLLILGT